MTTTSTLDGAGSHPRRSLARPASHFYVGMSALFVVIVAVGFAPTFYLRPYVLPAEVFVRHGPALPLYLVLHGTILTSWVVLAAVQPVLVVTRRVHLHRRLGVAGACLAVAVVAVSVWTVVVRDAPVIDEFPTRGFGNLMPVMTFSTIAGLGIYFRRDSDTHRRLMLIASIPLMGPALDRFARIALGLSESQVGAFIGLSLIVLLALVVVHDLVTRRRIHRGTAWGLAGYFLVGPLITAAIVWSGLWPAFVRLVT
jgi:hypothetical protein